LRIFALAVLACVSLFPAFGLAADPVHRMNFVFVLIDDLGWADLGCYGSAFYETPNLDALAASGARFTQAYAACPVCSPTRASILTGRHPVRLNITDWIPGDQAGKNPHHRFLHVDDRNELALEEVTFAELLQQAGYQTFFAGKWHLGGDGFLPVDQGFAVNIGGGHYGQPPGGYFSPYKNPYISDGPTGEYLTERLTQESVSFLKQRDPARPFLLFLSHYDVHTPIHKDEKHFSHFKLKAAAAPRNHQPIPERNGLSRSQQDNAEYASMVSAVDESIGQLMVALKEQGLEDSTTIIFTSDNGGLCTLAKPGPTSNLPLRSGKGWLYEGGVRVPLVMRIPGVTTPGQLIERPAFSTDYFPTILELAGLPAEPDLASDGESLSGLFADEVQNMTRPLAWHYPHYHGSKWTPGASMREGDWKLIEFYEFDEAELYHLVTDPGEHQNLVASEPEKLAELRANLKAWQKSMNASMPQPNPDWMP